MAGFLFPPPQIMKCYEFGGYKGPDRYHPRRQTKSESKPGPATTPAPRTRTHTMIQLRRRLGQVCALSAAVLASGCAMKPLDLNSASQGSQLKPVAVKTSIFTIQTLQPTTVQGKVLRVYIEGDVEPGSPVIRSAMTLHQSRVWLRGLQSATRNHPCT